MHQLSQSPGSGRFRWALWARCRNRSYRGVIRKVIAAVSLLVVLGVKSTFTVQEPLAATVAEAQLLR